MGAFMLQCNSNAMMQRPIMVGGSGEGGRDYLHVGPLPLLPLCCLLGIAQPLGGGPLKGVEVALVAGQLAAVQVQDVGAHHIQEVPSMGHHHQRLGPLA